MYDQLHDSPKIWIGIADVIPLPNNSMFDCPATGGFINAVAYANDENDFCEMVTRALEVFGVQVVEVESVSPLKTVLERKDIEPELVRAVQDLKPRDGVRFGSLFTYQRDE